MKRTATNDEHSSSNHELIVDNDYDDYSQQDSGRSSYPEAVRFRRVEYSRLRQPIILPRWARNRYRNSDVPTVPQLAPDVRVIPIDEMLVYEDGAGDEHQIDADQDGQIDVCAIEDNDSVVAQDEGNLLDAPIATKRFRSNNGQPSAVKLENDSIDASTNEQPRSERYRILRRTGNENLASRVRRENVNVPVVKNDDDLLLEYEGVANTTEEFVQEEIEVIDQEMQNLTHPFSVVCTAPLTLNRRATFNDPRSIVNLHELYEEMYRYAPATSIDAFNEIFGTESSMSYPLNVKHLMSNVKSASAEQNAKIIAALAMQVNFLKREINKLREDIVDTRSAAIVRQNHGITGRTFDLNASVSHQWFIPENPPLKGVDLVKTARDVSIRIGRKNMKTRDVITRYVRAVFDQMIPTDQIRRFTVRDRPSTRGNVLDIGINAKDQIIGIVLDLMGLYDTEVLNNNSRVDRANFSDTVNKAMKDVIYDMRRIAPKSKKPQRAVSDKQEIDREE